MMTHSAVIATRSSLRRANVERHGPPDPLVAMARGAATRPTAVATRSGTSQAIRCTSRGAEARIDQRGEEIGEEAAHRDEHRGDDHRGGDERIVARGDRVHGEV